MAFPRVDPSQRDVELTPPRADRQAVARGMTESHAPVMWFQRQGKSHVLTDPGLVAAGRELCQPMYWFSQAQTSISQGQYDMSREKSRDDDRLRELAERLADVSLRTEEARRKGADLT